MKQKIKLLLIVTMLCHIACTNKQKVQQDKNPETKNTHIDSVAKTLFTKAKYYESAALYTQIYIAAKQSQNKPKEAYAYEMLGNIATRQGQFETALSWYFQAHRTYQGLQDTLSKAWVDNQIGYVYVSIGQIDNGMRYYQSADTLASMIKDSARTKSLYGMLYMNISGIYLRRGNYDAFFQKAFKSLKCLENDSVNFAINYNNLGLAYKSMGEYDKAKYWLQKGLDIYLTLGDKQQLSMIYGNLGLIYTDQKSYAKAEKFLLNELELGTQINSVSSQKDGHYDLATVYQKTGDLQQALDHYVVAYELNEQMFSQKMAQSSAEMEASHQLALKQKEIEIGKLKLADKQKESYILTIFLSIAIIGLIVIGFFVWFFARSTKRARTVNKATRQSLQAASHIQSSLLPTEKYLQCLLSESFVLYLPKDIVSGDFYWVKSRGEDVFFAIGDCTGHGVPAALLSILGFITIEDYFQKEKEFETDFVVNYVNKQIVKHLATQTDVHRDGMDLMVCKLNTRTLSLEYAGTNLFLYVVNDDDVEDIHTDRYTLGQRDGYESKKSTIQLNEGETIYFASDGFQDQFGGPKDKKYSRKQFKELLLSIYGHPMDEQKKILIDTLKSWDKKKKGQTDDVLVMGIRI